MSTQWMTIQSFQSGQELLSALNTLSLHHKIKRAGKRDRQRETAVARARERLDLFLQEMAPVVAREEEGDTRPLLGVDARHRQLARSWATARKAPQRFQSRLFRQGFPAARELLYAEREEDVQALLTSLQELRMLLEEHVDTDATQLLGAI